MHEASTTNEGAVLYVGDGNLYLNITNRCTNDCVFCVRRYTDELWGYRLVLDREPFVEEVIAALDDADLDGYDEVVFTGFGEPLLRLPETLAITRYLKKRGQYVRIDTNGAVAPLYPDLDLPATLETEGVDAVSISLNESSSARYAAACRPSIPGSFEALLEFARGCRDAGMTVRLTVVDPEEVEACRRIAEDLGVGFIQRG